MTWPPVLEATRRQMGKLYSLAVRSDKEEFVGTHLDILWATAPARLGLQKNDARASTYVQQGYRHCARRPLAAERRIGLEGKFPARWREAARLTADG